MPDTAYKKSLSALVQNVMIDIDGQLENNDQSEGSANFAIATLIGNTAWGLHSEQDKIAKQIFPESADLANLKHHGALRDVNQQPGETRQDYLQRVLNAFRNPDAGGSDPDWEQWTRAVNYDHTTYVELIKGYFSFDNIRRMGSIDIVLTSTRTQVQGGDEEISNELLLAVYTALNAKRPKGIWDFLVFSAVKKTQNIVIEVEGEGDDEKTETDIISYMKNLDPGKKLYLGQLESLAMLNGFDNATVTTPAAAVSVIKGPYAYQRIWPGTVTVTRV